MTVSAWVRQCVRGFDRACVGVTECGCVQVVMSRVGSGVSFRGVTSETRSTVVVVEGLKTGTPYLFKVTSRVAGRTPMEPVGSNVLTAFASGLSQPATNVTVESTGSSQVTLAWSPPPGGMPVVYRIVRAPAGSTAWVCPVEVHTYDLGVPTRVTLTELSPLSAYDFRLYTGSLQGFETTGVGVTGVQPVGPPSGLAIRGVSSDAITVQWLPPASAVDPAAYRLAYTLGGETRTLADVVHWGGQDATQSALIRPVLPQLYLLQVSSLSLI